MHAIVFPNIDPVALKIGYISIRWYGISYVLGILLGLFIIQRLEKKYNIAKLKNNDIDNLVTYIIIGIVMGGRLGYILFYYPSIVFEDFPEIFKIWHGGMSFHGGLIGVVISVSLFCRKNKKCLISTIDLIACVVPIGLFFGRIANFINAELYGKKTDVALGVIFPNTDLMPRHPSQLYEAFFEGILLFIIMLVALKLRQILINKSSKNKSDIIKGFLSGNFLFFYAVFRILIENFREPDWHIGYIYKSLTLGQILSIPMLILGIALIYRVLSKRL